MLIVEADLCRINPLSSLSPAVSSVSVRGKGIDSPLSCPKNDHLDEEMVDGKMQLTQWNILFNLCQSAIRWCLKMLSKMQSFRYFTCREEGK